MPASFRNGSWPGWVCALGEPEARRGPSHEPACGLRPHRDLRAHGGGHGIEQRQERVGGARGQDRKPARGLVPAERLEEVRPVRLAVDALHVSELVAVGPGQLLRRRLAPRAGDLAVGQRDEAVEVVAIPREEQRVGQHREQRRRERERQPILHAVGDQRVEGGDQGNVRLGDRFEEPVLFEEMRLFRMTYVRKMGVQERAPVSGGCPRRRGAACVPNAGRRRWHRP